MVVHQPLRSEHARKELRRDGSNGPADVALPNPESRLSTAEWLVIPNPESRIPNPQSPIPNPESRIPALFNLLPRPPRVERFHGIERLEVGGLVIGFGDIVLALVAMQQHQAVAVFDPGNR